MDGNQGLKIVLDKILDNCFRKKIVIFSYLSF